VGYSVRLLLFSCMGVSKFFSFFFKSSEDFNLLFPIFVLSLGAVFGGGFFSLLCFEPECDHLFSRIPDKNLVFFVIFSGFLLGVFFFLNSFSFFSSNLHSVVITYFGGSMWFVQPLSTQGILFFPIGFFFFSLYGVDRGYMEFFGGQGFLRLVG